VLETKEKKQFFCAKKVKSFAASASHKKIGFIFLRYHWKLIGGAGTHSPRKLWFCFSELVYKCVPILCQVSAQIPADKVHFLCVPNCLLNRSKITSGFFCRGISV
jgi:hypothetical protein